MVDSPDTDGTVPEESAGNGDHPGGTPAMKYHQDRRVSWEFLFAALVLTLTLMAGMFFMGVALSDEKVGAIDEELEQFAVERQEQDLSQRIATNLPQYNCEALNVATRQTIDDINELREDMEIYEQARKLEHGEYQTLKRHYNNLLLEYWLTAREIEELCGSDVVKVVYIYSDDQDCPECGDQGTILTSYRQQYDDRLLVFPLDATLNTQTVDLIIDSYGIETFPALIIDDTYYEGFLDHDELGDILEDRMENKTVNKDAVNGTLNNADSVPGTGNSD